MASAGAARVAARRMVVRVALDAASSPDLSSVTASCLAKTVAPRRSRQVAVLPCARERRVEQRRSGGLGRIRGGQWESRLLARSRSRVRSPLSPPRARPARARAAAFVASGSSSSTSSALVGGAAAAPRITETILRVRTRGQRTPESGRSWPPRAFVCLKIKAQPFSASHQLDGLPKDPEVVTSEPRAAPGPGSPRRRRDRGRCRRRAPSRPSAPGRGLSSRP